MGVFGLASMAIGSGGGILGSGSITVQLLAAVALAAGTGAFAVWLFVRERARDKAEEALAAAAR